MAANDLERFLAISRRKTLDLLDAIEKSGAAAEILGWRPGPGRAHIAWQLMHIAATDDRHRNVRMTGGQPVQPEFVRRFAGGSTVDDDVPSLTVIRDYLGSQREAMLSHLRGLSPEDMDCKPRDDAPWTYREWFEVLAWHEAHHHGQAHLTYNLFRATSGAVSPRGGH